MSDTTLPRFRSVIFDCDSTLVSIEAIDELAAGNAEEVRRLTDMSMRGEVPLEDVYGRRLELISPTRDQVNALGELYARNLVEGAQGTVAALLHAGVQVRVISGGLLPAVTSVAALLGIPARHTAAVDIYFDAEGRYAGFDRTSPLARSGGKLEQIRSWPLPRPILMVGDGATDLEGRPAVDAFAAFTGVVERPAIAAAADFVVREMEELIDLVGVKKD